MVTQDKREKQIAKRRKVLVRLRLKPNEQYSNLLSLGLRAPLEVVYSPVSKVTHWNVPSLLFGHSFSFFFTIIWHKFSVSLPSSWNLWSESPDPGTPWWQTLVYATYMLHFLFSLSSWCHRYEESRIWHLEGMLQTIMKAVTQSQAHLPVFMWVGKRYYLLQIMLKVWQGLSLYKQRRKVTWLQYSLSTSSLLGLFRPWVNFFFFFN